MTASTSPPVSPSMARAVTTWGQVAIINQAQLVFDSKLFYCRATDTKGHGRKIGGLLPPDIHAQMMKLVFEPKFSDYSEPMDFVRDAIVHHINRRKDQIDDNDIRTKMQSMLDRLAFEEELDRAERETSAWIANGEKIDRVMTVLLRAEAWGQMTTLLDENEKFLEPIVEPYRSQAMEKINEWRTRIPK